MTWQPLLLPPPLKSCQISFLVQQDVQCSETYEKITRKFLGVFFCMSLSFWDMVDSNSDIFRIYIFFCGVLTVLHPLHPSRTIPLHPAWFWQLSTLASLVCVWINFAKISSRFFACPQFTVEYKIDHSSKTKNLSKKLLNSNIGFRTLHIFFIFVAEWIQIFTFLRGYISKIKNRKMDFWFVSEHWVTILTKK